MAFFSIQDIKEYWPWILTGLSDLYFCTILPQTILNRNKLPTEHMCYSKRE